MKLTGYEIIDVGNGWIAIGFGWLEKNGYIDYVWSPEEWAEMTTQQKRQWVVETNNEVTRRFKLLESKK